MQRWYKLTDSLPEECGAKARNLSLLAQSDITIPNGSVIVHSATIDTQLIQQATENLSYPLIIRSSSNVEDSSLHSLAGIFTSMIARSATEVATVIKAIHTHNTSAQVQELLSQYAISEDIWVSYVLQEYKASRRGGVMIVPERSGDSITIEVGDTPEQVTSGVTIPQSYTIKPAGHTKRTEKWLAPLVDAAQTIGKEYKGKQDVEWLEATDGQLYILQVRPYVSKASPQEVIAEEQHRLSSITLHAGHYIIDTLPDINSPTPATLSLLQKIYGQGIKTSFGLRKNVEAKKLFPIIAGQLYFDAFESASMFTPALLKPAARTRYYIRRLKLLRNLAQHKRLRKNTVELPKLSSDLPKLCNQIEYEIGPEIFKISDQLQIVQKQLQKKLHITADSHLLRDLSVSPLQKKADGLTDAELISQFWYLGNNEYELSAKRFSEQKSETAKQLRILAQTTKNKKDTLEKRNQALANYISIFDASYRKNLFEIYDTLQQERANLHDFLIKALATIRIKLLEHDTELQLHNTVWYATIPEILEERPPNKEELQRRKDHWQILQNLQLPTPNEINSWAQLVPLKITPTSHTIAGIELSSGYAAGVVCEDISHDHAEQKSILVTQSLSNEIMLKKDTLAGVITERGGALSHVSLLAREHNLAVIRVTNATKIFHEGDHLLIDTRAGLVSFQPPETQ